MELETKEAFIKEQPRSTNNVLGNEFRLIAKFPKSFSPKHSNNKQEDSDGNMKQSKTRNITSKRVNQFKSSNKSPVNAKSKAIVFPRTSNQIELEKNEDLEPNIPIYINEHYPNKQLERNSLRLAFISNNSKTLILKKIRLILALIDFIIILLSFVSATILYFDHFVYIHEGYIIDDNSNQVRFLCLILSIIQIILLIIRNKNIQQREILKYFLNYFNSPVVLKVFNKKLIIESIIHIIQPYPFIKFTFDIVVLGNNITYSLNMLLFLLSLIRFYYLYYIIDKWIIFSSEQAKRIYNFLIKFSDQMMITIKSILKHFGLISIYILFMVMLYMFSLVFKVMEDYDANKKFPVFTNITNCIWYIIVTMAAIGYGDMVPLTLIGRIIGVLCCIVGVFFISMLFVFLLLFTTLEEAEHKVRLLTNSLNIGL